MQTYKSTGRVHLVEWKLILIIAILEAPTHCHKLATAWKRAFIRELISAAG